MTEASYPSPVDKLLTYGKCSNVGEWPDYVKNLGFTAEHIPALLRMVTDEELNFAPGDSQEVWAPAHAWRVLARLKAVEAISPLIALFNDMREDDWFNEEMPYVFAELGEPALPELTQYLSNAANPVYQRIVVTNCIAKIGQTHPDLRAQCVAIITNQLAQFPKNSPELNGFLVSYLLDLEAVESAELMQQAFASKRVDISIAGDWNDVQVELGLKSQAEVYQLQHTVDAEHPGAKAVQPTKAQGFGIPKPGSKKSKKK